jgi:hypothetical protein
MITPTGPALGQGSSPRGQAASDGCQALQIEITTSTAAYRRNMQLCGFDSSSGAKIEIACNRSMGRR